jgi:hypothetical protein
MSNGREDDASPAVEVPGRRSRASVALPLTVRAADGD